MLATMQRRSKGGVRNMEYIGRDRLLISSKNKAIFIFMTVYKVILIVLFIVLAYFEWKRYKRKLQQRKRWKSKRNYLEDL